MKKLFAMLLMLCLLFSCAQAEEIQGAETFTLGEKGLVDLDGDGGMESVTLKMEGVPGEEYLALYLFGADGSFYSYEMYVMQLMEAFALDIDGDGLKELFVVCDFYSDDYVTYCFHYTEAQGMTALQFAGIDRYGDGSPYVDGGYGRITAVNGNCVSLVGSQDVLGTWMAGRDFALENGRFELVEGMYSFITDEEDWEYRPLILKQELRVTLEGGGEATLPAGEELLPLRSDRESTVDLIARDGQEYSVQIDFNDETGWGWFVNGIYEEDLFEYVPYAD